jgi:hypothetical protein
MSKQHKKSKKKNTSGISVNKILTGNIASASTRRINTTRANDMFGPSYGDGYAKSTYKPCHTEHPIIQFGDGEFCGASCLNPREGYDIYVGLDNGMSFKHSTYPWEPSDTKVIEFLFPIVDMQAPSNAENFMKLVEYLADQLSLGKRIHAGCIGGHGRTGTLIAALVAHITGELDSITWTRDNYCKKAVESPSQVDFLHKHFDVKKIEGSKSYKKPSYNYSESKNLVDYQQQEIAFPRKTSSKPTKFKAVKTTGSIWFDKLK